MLLEPEGKILRSNSGQKHIEKRPLAMGNNCGPSHPLTFGSAMLRKVAQGLGKGNLSVTLQKQQIWEHFLFEGTNF